MTNKPVDPLKLPLWKRKQPAGTARLLSDVQKKATRSRVELAGRRFPILVDNRWVARHVPRVDDLAIP